MENPNGAVAGNSQNNPTADVPRTRSTFNLKYHLFDTHRFGEYHPHYVADGVKGDSLPIRSSHNVLSYTLKSPLMQNIKMCKDYFSVPMEAILPINWSKVLENPVRGDDVAVDVGTSVKPFWNKVGLYYTSLWQTLPSVLTSTSISNENKVKAMFRFLIIGEYFYSNGSLLSTLGCHGAPYIRVSDLNSIESSFDKFFDYMILSLKQNLYNQGQYFKLNIDGYTYTVCEENLSYKFLRISLRHALALMRDSLVFTISDVSSTFDHNGVANDLQNWNLTTINADVPIDLRRLWAYQLVCAHYYSNDHIDFIYSADLYRSLIGSYISNSLASTYVSNMFFTYNGTKYQYDFMSGHVFLLYYAGSISTITATSMLTDDTSNVLNNLGYTSALLAFRRSLRYQDYFTGSRAHPLAVGSTGVTVVNNTVDVVDVTRNIQRQRFLNAVNRVRHNFEGYLQGIFGGDVPAPDYHNPFFLAHTDDVIYGQETENTASEQFTQNIAITTNLRSNGSRYMLEINCDRPCVLLGITYYDLPRIYTKTTERSFFHQDRFDDFNPFEQYVGDQQIYLQELGISPLGTDLATMKNFSYTLRHMEYKQRFSQACGGFVEFLPGFAFLAVDERGNQTTINPDWIRSVPSEFDNFYVSLTGYSNASYFHFIVDNENDCTGSRPMAYAPSIL